MNWVIGDIHGCLDKLADVFEEIRRIDKAAVVYCVGDLVNRGPDGKQTVDFVIQNNIQCVRGNHDDAFDCVINQGKSGYCGNEGPQDTLDWFCQYGMIRTLESYDLSPEEIQTATTSGEHDVILQKVPQTHKEFFRKLPPIIEFDNFFVCHARVHPFQSLEESRDDTNEMIWGRFQGWEIENDGKAWSKTGVFGHTPTYRYGKGDGVIFGPDIILCDTGAFSGRPLSAVCIETKQIVESKS